MEKWKEAARKLLFPPVWLMVLLTVISTVMLITVFYRGWEDTPLAYAVYVCSFYAVTAVTAYLWGALPRLYRRLRGKVYSHPLGNRYMTDAAFKVRVSLVVSLCVTLAYSAFHLTSGIWYGSFWMGGIAVYYILLSLIRFVLLNHMQRKRTAGIEAEYRSYRMTAALMLCINLTLSGIVLNMILGKKLPAMSDVFVITAAAYTFYILSMSIRDLIVYRRYHSPVLSAAKAVRFAQALVSLLSLEASMLVQFSDDENYRALMLGLTGAGVCAIVLGMSVYMIVNANRQMKKLEETL